MHGLNLALLVFAAFWAGAFVALLVRAMIEDAAQRRLGRQTVEAAFREGEQAAFLASLPSAPQTESFDDLGDEKARLLARSRGVRMRAKRLLRDA